MPNSAYSFEINQLRLLVEDNRFESNNNEYNTKGKRN